MPRTKITDREADRRLIERLISKDEQAIYELYDTHKPGIYRYILRQLNNEHLAEELTHDVFLDFIEASRDFQYQCSLKTFLYAIARNKTIDVIRKKKIQRILFSSLPPFVVEGLTSVLFDEEYDRRELAAKIRRVFEELPNDYALILRLKYIEQTPVGIIAERFSMGFKATESLLYRARKRFMHVFQKTP